MLEGILVQGFCALKIKVTRFPYWFRLNPWNTVFVAGWTMIYCLTCIKHLLWRRPDCKLTQKKRIKPRAYFSNLLTFQVWRQILESDQLIGNKVPNSQTSQFRFVYWYFIGSFSNYWNFDLQCKPDKHKTAFGAWKSYQDFREMDPCHHVVSFTVLIRVVVLKVKQYNFQGTYILIMVFLHWSSDFMLFLVLNSLSCNGIFGL